MQLYKSKEICAVLANHYKVMSKNKTKLHFKLHLPSCIWQKKISFSTQQNSCTAIFQNNEGKVNWTWKKKCKSKIKVWNNKSWVNTRAYERAHTHAHLSSIPELWVRSDPTPTQQIHQAASLFSDGIQLKSWIQLAFCFIHLNYGRPQKEPKKLKRLNFNWKAGWKQLFFPQRSRKLKEPFT